MEPIKQSLKNKAIKINEIYLSIQGESSYTGMPCVFVRTTGCHLRCHYCDTQHAFFNGNSMSIEQIIDKIVSFNVDLVLITGGEPLLYKDIFILLKKLCDMGKQVLLETSGAISIKKVDKRVKVILDVKTPSSGEDAKNVIQNLSLIWPQCEIKFVIGNEQDYNFSKNFIKEHALSKKCHILFSHQYGILDPAILAQWIIKDQLPVRFQTQLHKVLWGNKRQV